MYLGRWLIPVMDVESLSVFPLFEYAVIHRITHPLTNSCNPRKKLTYERDAVLQLRRALLLEDFVNSAVV